MLLSFNIHVVEVFYPHTVLFIRQVVCFETWRYPRAGDNGHPRHDPLFTNFPYQPISSPNQVPHPTELPPSSSLHQVPLLIKLPILNSDMTKFYTCPIQCCIHAWFSARYSAFGREFSGELDGSLAGGWREVDRKLRMRLMGKPDRELGGKLDRKLTTLLQLS